jgi:hypothetical protein
MQGEKMSRMESRTAVLLFAKAMVLLSIFFFSLAAAQRPGQRFPMISDWSHRHVVFSQPLTAEATSVLEKEPRYWTHILERNALARPSYSNRENADDVLDFGRRVHLEQQRKFNRDWGQSLGAGGSVGVPYAIVSMIGTWWPVYPAKYSFDVTANPDCTNDYAVFPTNLTGATGGQASIIGFNKLYAGASTSYCGVANPSVYFSYNTNFDNSGTATTGTVQTSPVLSLDGTKVAFVETRTSGGAILHLLEWHGGDGGSISTAAAPAIATVWTADGLTGHCPVTGACMISIVLHGSQSDTASSPFYDYQRDSMYVGDDNGVLHKIINAFGISGSSPSEVTSGNWPIIVHVSTKLTSPTLDSVSGNIFTGDSTGYLSYVRETFSTTGTCSSGSPPCLGSTFSGSSSTHIITDAPLVDSTTGKVFVFYGNNGSSTTAVLQSDITLSATVTATLGSGLSHHIHAGAFDNTYFTSGGSSGSMYVCGSSSNSTPTIQRIEFTSSGRSPASPFTNPAGTMNAAVDAVTLAAATGNTECTPVTEFFNPNAPAASQDLIFFGVQSSGLGTNCAGTGCVMSVNVTNTPSSLSILNSIGEIGGPSGIIVDNYGNTTTYPQASSLYFSNQGNSTSGLLCGGVSGVGCAVKVTQAGLN